MNEVFWTSWLSLAKVAVCAVTDYGMLVMLIRVMGKRTTSRMNNFDWIVTVAAGSIFAAMIILDDVSVVNVLGAISVLFGMQFALTFATSRWQWARTAFLSSPRVLYGDGEFFRDAMKKERVSEAEIISAVRESGAGSLDDTLAVVMKSDAEISVVKEGEHGNLPMVEPIAEYKRCGDANHKAGDQANG